MAEWLQFMPHNCNDAGFGSGQRPLLHVIHPPLSHCFLCASSLQLSNEGKKCQPDGDTGGKVGGSPVSMIQHLGTMNVRAKF